MTESFPERPGENNSPVVSLAKMFKKYCHRLGRVRMAHGIINHLSNIN